MMFYTKPNYGNKFWIFATNWGFSLMTLASIMDAVLVLTRYMIEKKSYRFQSQILYFERNSFPLKISVVLTTISYPMAALISIVFWAFILPYVLSNTEAEADINFNLEIYLAFVVHTCQVKKNMMHYAPEIFKM